MSHFNEMKSAWEQRNIPEIPKDGYKGIIKDSLHLKRKQMTIQVVLGVTIVVLLLFMFRISAFDKDRSTLGMLLMIGSLVLRVSIELFSRVQFKSLVPTLQFKEYSEKILIFYKSRLMIHYLITPVLFIIYIIGFIIMLPIFKSTLSHGFYSYIIFSSVFIFIFLTLLIIIHVKNEIRIINKMKNNMNE
ncbi:hypothetical protein F3J23_05400 [Chryseobacterium sp. Tr-659]|uniref:hypothetical protein n=1 Tax=Chryseobacterium sp. Tr-659 TaxID=2608340 RepID=UPI00141E1A59|nr:hypothetical protein [Chryseobacterium sp. Tr-659]NIF04870.1 hypothetical protein [Chryseobacterium sp. Tr-659]